MGRGRESCKYFDKMEEERTAWRLKLQNKMKLLCFPRDCGMEPAGHGAPGGSQEGASVLRKTQADMHYSRHSKNKETETPRR